MTEPARLRRMAASAHSFAELSLLFVDQQRLKASEEKIKAYYAWCYGAADALGQANRLSDDERYAVIYSLFQQKFGPPKEEADRILKMTERTRFYQASTSELYGEVQEPRQSESTPFHPRSPYAAAKLYAYWITVNYREAYGIHASNGILFNHESPRRGETFVTRKITRAAARISLGKQDKLFLGNLSAQRDWGHAKDFVEGMWRIVQHHEPDDFVLATGHAYSVRWFCERVFGALDMDLVWEGEGVEEKGRDRRTDQVLIEVDPIYFRPTEVDMLIGDATKARDVLGWEPHCTIDTLIAEMVREDLEIARQDTR